MDEVTTSEFKKKGCIYIYIFIHTYVYKCVHYKHPPNPSTSISQSIIVSFDVLAGARLKTHTFSDRVFDLLLIPGIICLRIGHVDFTEGSGHLGNAFISKRNLLGEGGTCFLGRKKHAGGKRNHRYNTINQHWKFYLWYMVAAG